MALTGERAGWIKAGSTDITVHLYEGNINVGTSRRPSGLSVKTAIAEDELEAGDWVEFFDDEALTSANTDMTPVVRKLTGAGVGFMGIVVEVFPASNSPEANQTDLAAMLAGGYLRKARVQPFGMTGYIQTEVTIPANEGAADSIDVGVPGNLAVNLAEDKVVYEATTDSEFVPLLHLEGSTTVPVTGPMIFGIGMAPLEKIAGA